MIRRNARPRSRRLSRCDVRWISAVDSPSGSRAPGGGRARRTTGFGVARSHSSPMPADARTGASSTGAGSGRVEERVQHRHREHPLGVADRPLEADRPADVVDDEVAAVDLERVDRLADPARRARSTSSRSRRGGRRGRGPGKSKATARRPWSASAGTTLRYRNELVGTPWTSTTSGPSPCSRTKLPHPARLEPAPGGLWTSITWHFRVHDFIITAISAKSCRSPERPPHAVLGSPRRFL